MNNLISSYLDILRVMSALLVVLMHIGWDRISGDKLSFFVEYGHDAVVVFFVISGYVITFVADTREKNLSNFVTHRVSRLTSVIFPALIIIPFIDYTGFGISDYFYEGKFQDSYFILRFLSNITFTQEIWFIQIRYLSDGPLWSIGYEFWYYMIFAIFMFTKNKTRIILLTIALLSSGPKILLLLPCWLLGVIAYKVQVKKDIHHNIYRLLFISCFIIFFYLKNNFYPLLNNYFEINLYQDIYSNLAFSKDFLCDWITAGLVSASIIFIKGMKDISTSSYTKYIKKISSPTFTIYVLHFPFLLFYSTLLAEETLNIPQIIIVFLLTTISCIYISKIIEPTKKIYVGILLKFTKEVKITINGLRKCH